MNRATSVAGAVLGAAALLGVGVAVGSQIGADERQVLAEAAALVPQGFTSAQEQSNLRSFIDATGEFEKLMDKAVKGDRSVGDEMTKLAVVVRAVHRQAETPELRDVSNLVSEAMLMISAGVVSNDGGITAEGIEAYKKANEQVPALTAKVKADLGYSESPAPEPSPS